MVDDDLRVREGAGQVYEVIQLGLEKPGIKGQAQGRQLGKALAEPSVPVEAGGASRQGPQDRRVCVRRGGVAYASEPRAGRHVRLEYAAGRGAQGQVNMTHDRRAGPDITVDPARRHGGDAIDELGLAHGPEGRLGAAPVHGAALHVDRRHDLVPAGHVRQQFVEEVAGREADHGLEGMGWRRQVGTPGARPVPEVVVGIDDRQVRLEDRLWRRQYPGHWDRPQLAFPQLAASPSPPQAG